MSGLRFVLDNFLGHEKMAFAPPPPSLGPPAHHIGAPVQQLPPTIPWLLINDTEVRSSPNNMPIFRISQSSAPGSLSSKSLITLTRASNGTTLGTARVRSSTGAVELAINGIISEMKDSMMMGTKHTFHPIAFPHAKWCWKKEKEGLQLSDDRDGRTIAALHGGTLVCENIGLSEAGVDEVVLSAVGVLANLKKLGKDAEAAEGIGEVISALAGGGA